ncbi:MAG: endonuclease/exonuclease/phosphatase family protein [Pirellulaceae bacterium]|nr:endonuclease/exonuclease/phosphatase family protein [Pirellulaceae bacterium]
MTDWSSVPVLYSSPPGTGQPGQIDFGQLQVTNDSQYLFLRIELGQEIILQETNSLQLLIDSDMNQSTGTFFNGLGAELIWSFGNRSGTARLNNQTTTVYRSDIGLHTGPTVSSSVFEIAIDRYTQVNGLPLFIGPTMRIAFRNGTSGDRIPLTGQTVSYTIQPGIVPIDPLPLDRLDASDLRIMTWNVLQDSPWDATQNPRFARIVAATKPDIISFQEIYSNSASQTAAKVASWYIPSSPPNVWNAAEAFDCKTLSLYPIVGSWNLSGNHAALIDTTAKLGKQLLLINAHLPCCSNDSQRQAEIDHILSFIRSAKASGGVVTLPSETPIIITGDMNLVTHASQLETLLTGQIVDQATYGPAFATDWDGGPLVNIMSRHTDQRMGYTWISPTSRYAPGMLDYHIYSSSVLQAAHHFIVNTQAMSTARLNQYGLQWNDSWASDHLAFVADYRLPAPPPGTIAGHYIYHWGWSGQSPNGQWDAIDTQKTLAKQTSNPQTLGLDNVISTASGVSGVVFDLAGAWEPSNLSVNDFVFQMSPQGIFDTEVNPPSEWTSAPAPIAVNVYQGEPTRVLIRWTAAAIQRRWLRVTVLANERTGLAEPEIYYIAQLCGEMTGPELGVYTVSFADINDIRSNIGQTVDASSSTDIDKNGTISFADITAMRSNISTQLSNITVP